MIINKYYALIVCVYGTIFTFIGYERTKSCLFLGYLFLGYLSLGYLSLGYLFLCCLVAGLVCWQMHERERERQRLRQKQLLASQSIDYNGFLRVIYS